MGQNNGYLLSQSLYITIFNFSGLQLNSVHLVQKHNLFYLLLHLNLIYLDYGLGWQLNFYLYFEQHKLDYKKLCAAILVHQPFLVILAEECNFASHRIHLKLLCL